MYKITVEKTITETRLCGKDWKIISKKADNPEYGYTPEIEKQVETRHTIYIQTVDELDLVSVINAVNSIV